MARPTVIDSNAFKEVLITMGYDPTKDGFKACIKEKIEVITMSELGRQLGISKLCLRDWMNRFDIKNPHKPGGNNNPNGCYGNKDCRRSNKAKEGWIYK